ncbi:reverse transcriptase domain-containing protein [Tanacetum coccineum]
MEDTRNMSELFQAPTEGYGDVIVIPAILAENFELKVGLLQLVTSSQFHGFERDDSHSHIRWFNKITSTLKYKNIPHEAIKLMLFPFSLEGAAQIWLEKEPHPASGNLLNRTPRDALTIIENKLKVRTLRNKPVVSKASTTSSSTPAYLPEITALTDVVKAILLQNKTPSPALVKAIEEIYVTCGGPHPYYECLATDGNTFNASAATGTYNQRGPGYRPQGETNYRASNQMRPPGVPQPNVQNNQNGYNQNRGNNFNQGNQNYQAPFNQTQVGPSNDFSNYMKTNDVNMRAMQNQISNMKTELKNEFQTTMKNQNNELKNMMSNELKNMMSTITTRSGVSYDGPTIPPTFSPLPKEVEREPEATKDKVLNDQKQREKANNQMLKFLQIFQRLHFDLSFADALRHMPKFASTFKSLLSNKEKLFELLDECLDLADLGASINLMPLSVWKKLSLPELTPTRMTLKLVNQSVSYPVGVAEDVFVKLGKFHFPADFVVVDYDVDPRVPFILERPFLRTARALIDVHGEELTLRVNDEAIMFNVEHTSRYSYRYDDALVNRIDVIDVTCEEYAQEVHGFLDSSKSGNPTPCLYPIITTSSSSLTPFEGGDFVLEEIEACLTSDSIPSGIDDADFDPEGDILLLEKLLNDDPSSPLPLKELNFEELKIIKSSIDDPPELELKDLPSHLEYAFLEDTYKLPVIIAKNLQDDEKARLTSVPSRGKSLTLRALTLNFVLIKY